MNFKQALRGILDEHEQMPMGFDVVGDIAILEIPEELAPKERRIGESFLQLFKHITVVVKKMGIHRGMFRLQQYKIIAGKRRKTTVHRENGVRMKLHLEKTYFSPRLAHERLRIAELIRPGEHVLVLFSGIAPFPLVIAKNARPAHVVGIELNSAAHEFALENVKLNKMGDKITLYKGDVRNVVKKLRQRFDRIIMPLPKDAEMFLGDALRVAKKGTRIHLYHFGTAQEVDGIKEEIKAVCKSYDKKIQFLDVVKAGEYAPRVYRFCFDFKVIK